MAEEISSTGNLDLNLHPDDPESGRDPARMIELSQLFTTSANGATLPVCQRSTAGAGRVSEVVEKCENGMKKDNVTEEKKEVVKSVCKDDSFFNWSISLDLSKNPVLSKCDHLYCWAGLYLWLLYLWAKECPTFKGDASVTTLPPLIGRGKHRRDSKVSDTKTPPRPLARRIRFKTSFWRGVSTPTEMISQFEREFSSTGERRHRPLLNSFMTSRGLRAEQNLSSEALITPTGVGRNQVQNSTPTVDVAGNDSESSTFHVINLESEVDTDEIESMLTVPASPSVEIHENGSRVPDVDSEGSPPLRRRRLT